MLLENLLCWTQYFCPYDLIQVLPGVAEGMPTGYTKQKPANDSISWLHYILHMDLPVAVGLVVSYTT